MKRSLKLSFLLLFILVLPVIYGSRYFFHKLEEQDISPGRILIVGMDGATFTVLDPLIKKGSMPTIEGLIKQGVRGPLRSEEPMSSPILWNTIFTGVSPEEHGIDHFIFRYKTDEGEAAWRMYNSQDRKAYALWNILSASDKTVGMIGFWTTWPSENVNGYIVSDHVTYSRWSYFDPVSFSNNVGLTYPKSLYEEIKPFVLDPARISSKDIREIADFMDAEISEIKSFKSPDGKQPGSHLKFDFSAQLSYERICLEMLDQREQPDLLGVYLVATDSLGHKYWHYYMPDMYEDVPQARAARWGQVIPGVYRHNDRYIEKLIKDISKDTAVIIVSDHGMRASGKITETESNSGIHDLYGVFIASGRNIKQGVKLREVSIYDIAPTVLALLNLPVPENLPGKVLTQIIKEEYLVKYPIRRVPPLAPRSRDYRLSHKTMLEEYRLDHLRSLGYIR